MNNEEILQLLQIMDLAVQWPEFKGLHDMAQAQLLKANQEAVAELKAEADHKVKAQAAAEAKRVAEQEAKARAEEEATRRTAQQADARARAMNERPAVPPAPQPPSAPEVIERRDV